MTLSESLAWCSGKLRLQLTVMLAEQGQPPITGYMRSFSEQEIIVEQRDSKQVLRIDTERVSQIDLVWNGNQFTDAGMDELDGTGNEGALLHPATCSHRVARNPDSSWTILQAEELIG